MTNTFTIDNHFADKDPSVRTLYKKLLEVLNTFGPIIEEPKKNIYPPGTQIGAGWRRNS